MCAVHDLTETNVAGRKIKVTTVMTRMTMASLIDKEVMVCILSVA